MKYLILLASTLLISSCGPVAAGKKPSPVQEESHVVLTDHWQASWLKVVKTKMEKLSNGTMEVALEMENGKDKNIPCDIQVIFRGADGFEIEKTSWTPFIFNRREVSTFKASSMSTAPVDYRIIIRKPE